MIKQQVFQIEGTSGRLYDLGVLLADDILSLSCNCPAGTQKQLCKHVRRILSGDLGGVLSEEGWCDLQGLWGEIKKTNGHDLLQKLEELERSKDALDAEIKRAKKGLALALSKGLVKK